MRVEVRPLPKNTIWHGKKEEESFTRPKKVQVLVNPQTGRLATGLTEEQAKEYGKLLGLDLSDNFDPENPHPYWSTSISAMILRNETMVFDTDIPRDFVKIANMKACKFIANSLKEYEAGLFPYATHVIHDEEAEYTRQASIINVKKKAFELSLSMGLDEKCDIIQILANKSLRGKSQNFIDVEIDNLITNSPSDFVKLATLDKNQRFVHALINEALYRNILTKEGSAVCYMGDTLGHTIEDTISYFQDPNNQAQKAIILDRMSKNRSGNNVGVSKPTALVNAVTKQEAPKEIIEAPKEIIEEKVIIKETVKETVKEKAPKEV